MSVIRTSERMRSGDYVYTGTRYYETTGQISGSGYLRHTFSLNNQPVGSTFSIGVNTDEVYVNEAFTVGTARTYDRNNVLIQYSGGNTVAIRYYSSSSSGYMSCFLAYIEYAGLSCKAYSQVKTSYAAIPNTIEFVLTPSSTVCPVTSLEGCFENCRLTSAPTIPSGITNMTRCFYGCSRLTGNISVNNTPTAYTNAFGNTSKDIFLLNNGGNVWQTIAGSYSNVHYEADDNPAPSVTAFTVTRVSGSGQTEYSARGEWAYIQATVNVSTAAIPVGWTNSLKSVTLKKDGTVITPTWTPSSPTSFPAVMETWVNTGDLGTHSFSIQIADSIKNNGTEVKSTSSAELTISLLKVYTLVDYYHDQTTGTEGIAFGKYAESADLFEVDMAAKFDQGLNALDDIITTKNLRGKNALLELDTTATSGSDKEIYDALVSLGWTDCIV